MLGNYHEIINLTNISGCMYIFVPVGFRRCFLSTKERRTSFLRLINSGSHDVLFSLFSLYIRCFGMVIVMSMNRAMKRRMKNEQLKQMDKPLGQKLSPSQRQFAERIEKSLIEQGEAIGHLKGLSEASDIYKERLINDVFRIEGIGPKRRIQIAKALGFSELAKELEKKR